MSGRILELITDPDKANNKDMKIFDSNKESSYLMYFDANSLYSKAMCFPLPVGNFKWLKTSKK